MNENKIQTKYMPLEDIGYSFLLKIKNNGRLLIIGNSSVCIRKL